MWLKELGELYNEGWGATSPIMPQRTDGTIPPVETKDSIRMKGIFGSGDSPPNDYDISMASGHNPYEQEEDQVISKNLVLKLVQKQLDELDSDADNSTKYHLSLLQKQIQNL